MEFSSLDTNEIFTSLHGDALMKHIRDLAWARNTVYLVIMDYLGQCAFYPAHSSLGNTNAWLLERVVGKVSATPENYLICKLKPMTSTFKIEESSLERMEQEPDAISWLQMLISEIIRYYMAFKPDFELMKIEICDVVVEEMIKCDEVTYDVRISLSPTFIIDNNTSPDKLSASYEDIESVYNRFKELSKTVQKIDATRALYNAIINKEKQMK